MARIYNLISLFFLIITTTLYVTLAHSTSITPSAVHVSSATPATVSVPPSGADDVLISLAASALDAVSHEHDDDTDTDLHHLRRTGTTYSQTTTHTHTHSHPQHILGDTPQNDTTSDGTDPQPTNGPTATPTPTPTPTTNSSDAELPPAVVPPAAVSIAQVFNKPNLTRIQGVGYQPAPIGMSPEYQAHQEEDDLYGISYSSTHSRDIPLIAAMGANVVRIWLWYEDVDHSNFLDICHQYGVYVILTFNPDYGFPTGTWDVMDERPAEWDLIKQRFRKQLTLYQNHPAVLMWMIGNEPSTTTGLTSYFKLTNQLSQVRDSMCPRNESCWHPISIPFADLGPEPDDLYNIRPQPVDILSKTYTPLEKAYPNAVDIWSFQIYRGVSFGTFFNEYSWFQRQSGSIKPMFMSEFGLDVLDFRIGSGAVNETMQSSALVSLWDELASWDTRFVVGGCVFEYVDEWWKGSQYSKPVLEGCPVSDYNVHSPCGRAALGNPDQFYSEAWYGMVGYSFPGTEAESNSLYMAPSPCIYPRDSYFTMMGIWAQHNMTTDQRQQLCSNQQCCAARTTSSLLPTAGVIGSFVAIALICQLYARHQYKKQAAMQVANISPAKSSSNTSIMAVVPMSGLGNKAPYDPVPPMSSQSSIEAYIYELLTPCFHGSCHLFYRVVTADPIGYHAHVCLQHHNLTRLLLQQYYRCDGNLVKAIERVHLRSFEAYVAWCKHVGTSPRFKEPLEDLAQAYVLWSTAEQLRRVSSYSALRFHYRHVLHELPQEQQPKGKSKEWEWQTPHQLNTTYQTKVSGYTLDYDDVEDTARQSHSILGKVWYQLLDNIRAVHAYPRLGGWPAIMLDSFWIIQFHVVLAILIIDAINSPVVQADTGGYVGLVDIYLHLTSSYGPATLIKLCIADVAMVGIHQIFDSAITLAPRLVHAALIALSAVALPILGVTIPMLPLPILLSGISSHTFALLWLVGRILLVSGITVYSIVTMHTHTLLPAANRDFKTYHTEQATRTRIDTISQESSKLMHHKNPKDPNPPIPNGTWASGSGATTTWGRARRRCGWQLWYAARNVGFWAVVMLIKIIFDMYVLWPSVVGVTWDTLCYAAPSVSASQLDRGTATFMRQQQTVFLNNSDSPLSTVRSLTDDASAAITCNIFIPFLWGVTFVMSLATSYVSYTTCIGLFGILVPQITGSSTSRWHQPWIGVFLVLWFIVLIIALAVGAFYAAISTGLLLIIIDRILAVNRHSNYESCRSMITQAVHPTATTTTSSGNHPPQAGNNGKNDKAQVLGSGGFPIPSPTSIHVVSDDKQEKEQLTDLFAGLSSRRGSQSLGYATINLVHPRHSHRHEDETQIMINGNGVSLSGTSSHHHPPRHPTHHSHNYDDDDHPSLSKSKSTSASSSYSNISHLTSAQSYSSLQQLATRSLRSHYRTLAPPTNTNTPHQRSRSGSVSSEPHRHSNGNSPTLLGEMDASLSQRLLAFFASDHVIPITAVRLTRDGNNTKSIPITTSNIEKHPNITWMMEPSDYLSQLNASAGSAAALAAAASASASSLLSHLLTRITARTASLSNATSVLSSHAFFVSTPTGKLPSASSNMDRFLMTVVDELRRENTKTQQLPGASPITVDQLKQHIHTWIKQHMHTRIEFSGAKIDITQLSQVSRSGLEHAHDTSRSDNSSHHSDKEMAFQEKDSHQPMLSSDPHERILLLYMIALSQILNRNVVILSSASCLDQPDEQKGEKEKDDTSLIQITIQSSKQDQDTKHQHHDEHESSPFQQYLNEPASPLSTGALYFYHQRSRASSSSYRLISMFHPVCVWNPLITKVGCVFQCMFRRQLNPATTRLIWKSIIESMWRSDLLSTQEIKETFSLDHPESFMIHTPMISETRHRFTWFFHSLVELSQKSHDKLPSLLTMRSTTVLIPMYDETVYYTAQELCEPQVKYAPTESTFQEQHQHRVTVIEFLAEKHVHEWNNLAQRTNFPQKEPAIVGSHDTHTDQSRALLNHFMAQHSPLINNNKRPTPIPNWHYYSECVVNWASERGQTLARTVRGMIRIRAALILTGLIELNGDIDTVRHLVDRKFQILVSAQVYAERSRTVYRDGMRKLMKQFPSISIVYNYDLMKDIQEQTNLKVKWHKACTQVSTEHKHDSKHQQDQLHALSKNLLIINDVLGPALMARKLESSSQKTANQNNTSPQDKLSIMPSPSSMEESKNSSAPSPSPSPFASPYPCLGPTIVTSEAHAIAFRDTMLQTLQTTYDRLDQFAHLLSIYTQGLNVHEVPNGNGKDEKQSTSLPLPSDGDMEISAVSDICWRSALSYTCKQLISLCDMVSRLNTGYAYGDGCLLQTVISHIQHLITSHERCDEYQLEMSAIHAVRMESQKLHHSYQDYVQRALQQQIAIMKQQQNKQDMSQLSTVSFQLRVLDDVDTLISGMHSENQRHHHEYHLHIKHIISRINKLCVGVGGGSIQTSRSVTPTRNTPPASSRATSPSCSSPSPSPSVFGSPGFDRSSSSSSISGLGLFDIDIYELNDLLHEWRTCLDLYLDDHYEEQRFLLIYNTIMPIQQASLQSIEQQHVLLGWLLTHIPNIPQQYTSSLQDATYWLAQQQQQHRSNNNGGATVDQQLHTATRRLVSWLNNQLKNGLKRDFDKDKDKDRDRDRDCEDECMGDHDVIEISTILKHVTTALTDLLERAIITTYQSNTTPPLTTLSQVAPSQLQPSLDRLMNLIMTNHTTQINYRHAFMYRLTQATQTQAINQKLLTKVPHDADGAPVTSQQLYGALSKVAIFPYASVNCRDGSTSSSSSYTPLDEVIFVIDRQRDLMLGSMPAHSTLRGCPQTNPKSENQLHALIFGTGEIIQAIDMNQDLSYEEALKFRWFTQEFQYNRTTDIPRFNLIGSPEVIYTEKIGAVGRYMALQDLSFATIVQRVLAYTGSRMHYGHPDLFDGYWIRFHVALSKASTEKNLSEDVYFGYDSISRGQQNAYAEYIRFGKGREVGISTTVVFEDKLARGSAHTLKSPDVYRLSRWLDCITYLSLIFGSLGHYLYTLLFDYTITSFLWVLLFMTMSNISSETIGLLGSVYAVPWLFHLGFMFGLPLLLQLIHERGPFDGFMKWGRNVLLGSVYYLFQLRTKAFGIQIVSHGGSGKYRGTGRSFELGADSLLHLYQNYARSHYHHALELIVLLFCYVIFFSSEPFFYTTMVKTYAIIFAIFSWICAPALFNPSFNYQTHRQTIIREHISQVKEVKRWLDAPYMTANNQPNNESWERWYWSDRYDLLRLRACRYYMQSGIRQTMHHPIIFSLTELLFRCVEWAPWCVLSVALIVNSGSIFYSVVGYILVVLVIHALAPRLLHMMILICIVLGAYAIVYIQHLLDSPHAKPVADQWILSFSNLSQVLACIVAFIVLAVMITDLLLHINDGFVCYGILKENDKNYVAKQKEKEQKSGKKQAVNPDDRPILIRLIMNSPFFVPWLFVYRVICPYAVVLIHFIIILLNNIWSRAHTSFLYDCSLDNLRIAQQARTSAPNTTTPTTASSSTDSNRTIVPSRARAGGHA